MSPDRLPYILIAPIGLFFWLLRWAFSEPDTARFKLLAQGALAGCTRFWVWGCWTAICGLIASLVPGPGLRQDLAIAAYMYFYGLVVFAAWLGLSQRGPRLPAEWLQTAMVVLKGPFLIQPEAAVVRKWLLFLGIDLPPIIVMLAAATRASMAVLTLRCTLGLILAAVLLAFYAGSISSRHNPQP